MLNSCKFLKKEEPVTQGEGQIVVKKKTLNPNMKERVLEREDGGIFNSASLKRGTTYDFATSNVMWRATLEVFNNIPLSNVDYAGGVIISDWYSKWYNFCNNNCNNSSIMV